MAKASFDGKTKRADFSVHVGFRFPLTLARRVRRAAKAERVDESEFVRRAVAERANRVLEERQAVA